MRTIKIASLALLGAILSAYPARAWFAEGHEVVAIIAADDLTPIAKSHVGRILGVPTDSGSLVKAMAAASIRPDTEFRADRTTPPWHYIDVCLQDKEQDLPARCPRGNCVTAKIDEYARRLRDGDYDKWNADGDLAFRIHFVGDIHQPLHAATDGDHGGTWQEVNVEPAEKNLHYAWDDAVVMDLEKQLGTHDPEATARKLEALYPAGTDGLKWNAATSQQIAWESHELAKTEVYAALGIPERPCELSSCDAGTTEPVSLSSAYMDHEATVAGRQLVKAGHRLAALLNQIWSGDQGR